VLHYFAPDDPQLRIELAAHPVSKSPGSQKPQSHFQMTGRRGGMVVDLQTLVLQKRCQHSECQKCILLLKNDIRVSFSRTKEFDRPFAAFPHQQQNRLYIVLHTVMTYHKKCLKYHKKYLLMLEHAFAMHARASWRFHEEGRRSTRLKKSPLKTCVLTRSFVFKSASDLMISPVSTACEIEYPRERTWTGPNNLSSADTCFR